MHVEPVKRERTPAYPTRDELLADREVLKRHVPRRWRKRKGLASAAAALVVGSPLAGCGSSAPHPGPPSPNPLVAEAAEWTRSIMAPAPPPAPPPPVLPSRPAVTGLMILRFPEPPEDEAMQILDEVGLDARVFGEGQS